MCFFVELQIKALSLLTFSLTLSIYAIVPLNTKIYAIVSLLVNKMLECFSGNKLLCEATYT